MKDKIKEVQDYFKAQLLSGNFVITKKTEHHFTVMIDEEYTFTIWTGNHDIPNTRCWYSTEENIMMMGLNQKERIKLHGVLFKDVKAYRDSVLKAKKLKEFDSLKKELGL